VKRKYFGTDGIRGRVGEGHITAEFVLKLGWAAGRVLGNGPGSKVLIGKDTRISGYLFESALEAGLAAAGVNINLLGPMPTPGIAYLTRTLHAQAGIVISASHNPHHDNGIKFFSGDGDKLADEIEHRIEAELDKPMTTVGSELLGKARRVEDAAGRYIEFCKSTIPAVTSLKGMKIVVDCANGATYHVAPHVFDEMGATVVRIGCEPNGLNINDNVGSTSPAQLQQAVLRHGADLGVGFDGDGDRLVMVDNNGRLIDGDAIIYIIARSRQMAGALHGPVVGTVMTNLGLEHALQRHGAELQRTAVGDRYIMERLKESGGVIGGEPSGHVICRDRTSTGDGIISALQVLAEMVKSGNDFDALLQGVETYPQSLINVALPRKLDVLSEPQMKQALIAAEQQLNGAGRVLLRASGTEPLLRVMVEGQDKRLVESLAEHLAECVAEQVRRLG
jgi:phosphoglucosamine mutase